MRRTTAFRFLVTATAVSLALSCGESPSEPGIAGGLQLRVTRAPGVTAQFDEGRIFVQGPTSRTVTLEPGQTDTIAGLEAGSYTIAIEGLLAGEVELFGETGGIRVAAGRTTVAVVALLSFQPTIETIGSETVALRRPVEFSQIQGASAYIVEWSRTANFLGSEREELESASGIIAVSDTGLYYLRVKAKNRFGSVSRASSVDTFRVTEDIIFTGINASVAPSVSASTGVDTTLTGINIVPASDIDWFGVLACETDTIEIETFAEQLSPNSSLDTRIELYDSTGIVILASNDDGVGVDSRLTHVSANDDRFAIRVSGVKNTIGRYDLAIRIRPGGINDGSACQREVAQLNFITQPNSATAGSSISPAIQVEVRDAQGRLVLGGADSVRLSIGSNPGGGTLMGTLAALPAGGIATLMDVAIDKAAGGYTLVATSGAVSSAASASFSISAAAPNRLAFTRGPRKAGAGGTVESNRAFIVDVTLFDVFGNLATSAGNAVTLTLDLAPAGSTLSGATTRGASAGVVMFTNLFVDRQGTYRLLATSPGLLSALTGNFFVIEPFDGSP